MVYDAFNVLLNLVCQYFVEDFFIHVHWRCWSKVFFSYSVFKSAFGIKVILAPKNKFGSVLSFSVLWKRLRSIDTNSFFFLLPFVFFFLFVCFCCCCLLLTVHPGNLSKSVLIHLLHSFRQLYSTPFCRCAIINHTTILCRGIQVVSIFFYNCKQHYDKQTCTYAFFILLKCIFRVGSQKQDY